MQFNNRKSLDKYLSKLNPENIHEDCTDCEYCKRSQYHSECKGASISYEKDIKKQHVLVDYEHLYICVGFEEDTGLYYK
ncbi:MAG: hypothetical protein ACYCSQ_00330 [bacterium]